MASMQQTTDSALRPRVAFQGELGAYSDEALREFFGPGADPVPCRTFEAVRQAVRGGESNFGLLPIENSLAGSVVASVDVLGALDLAVIGEIICPIHHCALAVPGATLAGLRRILSHPVALAQCTHFLERHANLEAAPFYDTAGAARSVAATGDPTEGAVASRLAAQLYGLSVLEANIEDRPDNQTRFLVVTRPDGPRWERASVSGEWRTSLFAETANAPGSLVRLLVPFADRGVNLSKLESRPGLEPWTYRFFIEFDDHVQSSQVQEALAMVREHASTLHILGSYPRWRA